MSEWIFRSLAASTLLMLAVMAVRPWIARLWGPRVAYALWLLPLIRLLCPPLPVLPAAILPTSALEGVQASPRGLDGFALALAAWLAGACIFLAMHWRAYRRVLASAWRAQIGPALRLGAITLVRSAAVAGPFAAGLTRRVIFVPVDFDETFDDAERRLVLAHETAHHRRGDLWANFGGLLVLSAHWFNPIAHRAHRLYRLDQELACDADVLARHADARFSYGRTLAKASGGLPAALCALSDAAMLKLRLRHLAASDGPRSRPLATLGLLVLGLILAGGTAAVNGPALIQAERLVAHSSPQPRNGRAVLAAPPTSPAPRHKSTVPLAIDHDPRQAALVPLEAPPSPIERAALRGRPVDDPAYLAQRRAEGLEQRRLGARDAGQPLSPAERAALRGRPVGDPAYLAQRIAQGLERGRSSG